MTPIKYTVSLNDARSLLASVRVHKDSRIVTRWYDRKSNETRNHSNHQLGTTKTFVRDLIRARALPKGSPEWVSVFFNNYHVGTGKYGAGHARKFKDTDDIWLEITVFQPFDYMQAAAELDSEIAGSIKGSVTQTDVVLEGVAGTVTAIGTPNLVMVGAGAKNVHIKKRVAA